MATKTHESLAADAAAYLVRSGDIFPRSRGDALEIRRQSERLRQWAKEVGCLIDYAPPAAAPQSRGAEHEVFFHESNNRVFKRTYPGTFGSVPTTHGLRRTATPYFYLYRLELINQIFSSDLRLEGVTAGDAPSVITSQPWAHPADPRSPLPSLSEVREFMVSLGFEPIHDAPFDWFRASDGIRISDARPDNFIKTEYGVVPIDLIASRNDQ
jgi:hypothetical protein